LSAKETSFFKNAKKQFFSENTTKTGQKYTQLWHTSQTTARKVKFLELGNAKLATLFRMA